MADGSSDIIELQSSDDEATEPAPKKAKPQPPMVSIPKGILNSSQLKKKSTNDTSRHSRPSGSGEKRRINPLCRPNMPVILNQKLNPVRNTMPFASLKIVKPPTELAAQKSKKVIAIRIPSTGPVNTGRFPGQSSSSPGNTRKPPIKLPPGITVKKTVVVPQSQYSNRRFESKPQTSNRRIESKPQTPNRRFESKPQTPNRRFESKPQTPNRRFESKPLKIPLVKMHSVPLQNQAPVKTNMVPLQNRSLPIAISRVRSLATPQSPVKKQLQRALQNQRFKPYYVPTGEVLPVEHDTTPIQKKASTAAAPKWYMKPEENNAEKIKQNNEAEPNNMIEIVIEDSPAKPSYLEVEVEATPKKTVNNQQPKAFEGVIIEDSPAKPVEATPRKTIINKQATQVFEDIVIEDSPAKPEEQVKTVATPQTTTIVETTKTPQSKKKLEFPKRDAINETETAMEADDNNPSKIVTVDIATDSTENRKENADPDNEFHPVYNEFIDLCFEMEKSADMDKIVAKKIKGYYRQVDKSYTNSHSFIHLVMDKIKRIREDPDNLFLFIKDVVDELNVQRKMPKAVAVVIEETPEASKEAVTDEVETIENESITDRNIRKLEKTMFKLHRVIQKLEEQEIDFDDENDSSYLHQEKFKARLIRVHNKLNQLRGTKVPAEGRVKLEPAPGRPPGPTKKLEKWINKKVPVGAPLPFPDFHDVLKCVREANKEDQLGWAEYEMEREARELFTRCGKRLQRRRQQNEWRTASVWLPNTPDPAEADPELKKKLDYNKRTAIVQEKTVIDRYADRQHQLNLQPEEVKEDEIDKSDNENESDDDLILLEEETALTANLFKPKIVKEEVTAENENIDEDKSEKMEIEESASTADATETREKIDESNVSSQVETDDIKDAPKITNKDKTETDERVSVGDATATNEKDREPNKTSHVLTDVINEDPKITNEDKTDKTETDERVSVGDAEATKDKDNEPGETSHILIEYVINEVPKITNEDKTDKMETDERVSVANDVTTTKDKEAIEKCHNLTDVIYEVPKITNEDKTDKMETDERVSVTDDVTTKDNPNEPNEKAAKITNEDETDKVDTKERENVVVALDTKEKVDEPNKTHDEVIDDIKEAPKITSVDESDERLSVVDAVETKEKLNETNETSQKVTDDTVETPKITSDFKTLNKDEEEQALSNINEFNIVIEESEGSQDLLKIMDKELSDDCVNGKISASESDEPLALSESESDVALTLSDTDSINSISSSNPDEVVEENIISDSSEDEVEIINMESSEESNDSTKSTHVVNAEKAPETAETKDVSNKAETNVDVAQRVESKDEDDTNFLLDPIPTDLKIVLEFETSSNGSFQEVQETSQKSVGKLDEASPKEYIDTNSGANIEIVADEAHIIETSSVNSLETTTAKDAESSDDVNNKAAHTNNSCKESELIKESQEEINPQNGITSDGDEILSSVICDEIDIGPTEIEALGSISESSQSLLEALDAALETV